MRVTYTLVMSCPCDSAPHFAHHNERKWSWVYQSA